MTDNKPEVLLTRVIKVPQFGLVVFILHFLMACIISWVVITFSEYLGVGYWVDILSNVIPSIAGMAAISPNVEWAKIYMLACWLGAPYYIINMRRLAAILYPEWVKQQTASRFWLVMIVLIIGLIGMLFVPSSSIPSTVSSESVRVMDQVTVLMMENYIVFSLMGFGFVCAFSIFTGIVSKAIQLRLLN